MKLNELIAASDERSRRANVRAFSWRRRLLKVLSPLVKLTARMEGKAERPWLQNENWKLAEARRRRDELNRR